MHLRFLSWGRRGKIEACEKTLEQLSVMTSKVMIEGMMGQLAMDIRYHDLTPVDSWGMPRDDGRERPVQVDFCHTVGQKIWIHRNEIICRDHAGIHHLI